MQLIAGFGIPLDLTLEAVTLGYVLKATYLLPYNVTQLRKPTTIDETDDAIDDYELLENRKIRSTKNQPKYLFGDDYENSDENNKQWKNERSWYNADNSRWILYRAIEVALDRYKIYEFFMKKKS